TIRNFIQAVRPGKFDSGILDDCRTEGIAPPKTHWARPIDVAPFIGYPLRPGITFTYLGLKVDQNARVLMQDERPSANLFAAGEIMAGNILGEGYIAGIGMAIGTVFGQIAGREAAKLAHNENRSGSAALDENLHRLPLLRGILRGFHGHGIASSIFDWRPGLSRQPLP